MKQLDMLLTGSEPGASLHHLHTLVCPAAAVGPLGGYDPASVQFDVHAFAPAGDRGFDTAGWLARAIAATGRHYAGRGKAVLFAGLAQEVWSVRPMDELARRLNREGRLEEHPGAVESTLVYAACHDGRRWRGRRYLSGPQAGTADGVATLVGRLDAYEAYGMPAAPHLRRLVGLSI